MAYLFLLLLGLTIIFWILRGVKIFPWCPICAAFLIIWIFGLALIYLESSWSSLIFTAVLMGASLGAIAEKFGQKLGFYWKTLWLIFGAAGVYFLLNKEFFKALPFFAAMLVATWLFAFFRNSRRSPKDRFNECC